MKPKVNYKQKVARTTFIIMVTFMICRLPFTVLIFLRNQLLKNQKLSPNSPVQNQVNGSMQILWIASKYLIFVNAALNPVIYGLTNEKFRKAFRTTPLAMKLLGREAKTRLVVEGRKKPKDTNETVVASNKSKIFILFKGISKERVAS